MMVIDLKMKPLRHYLSKQTSTAPVVLFRIAFGVMMALSIVRFWAMGWIDQLYIKPSFFFSYYGFEWVKPLSASVIYVLFAAMFLSAIFIALGLFYRIASVLFFLAFTYVELIDKSTYLNHYYFISLVALLLCFIPAHKQFSLDVKLGITKAVQSFPKWMLFSLQLQMAIVYFFAGIAKINHDWLFEALPLRLWLPTKNNLPIIGYWLNEVWVAYVFSWCGMLFDTLIPFFLFWRKTTYWAYALVVIFHVLTAILFPGIGMFPFIMIVCATVFLPASLHHHILVTKVEGQRSNKLQLVNRNSKLVTLAFLIFFSFQISLPFRYVFYPENLFWHEQGYRFSWRVMLMEKAGLATFHIREKDGSKIEVVNNSDYLTPMQEKQMSTQPDMLLQFAKHLAWIYTQQGWKQPEVYVESYVTLNGKGSRLFIDPSINLAAQNDGFANKQWILPFNYEQQKQLAEK
jgi:hypothetical protein